MTLLHKAIQWLPGSNPIVSPEGTGSFPGRNCGFLWGERRDNPVGNSSYSLIE